LRVLLYHNPRAGHDEQDPETLVTQLQRAGHDVRLQNTSSRTLSDQVLEGVDVIVTAGGDGSVARAARQLAGRSIAIAILPLGTANNLAALLRSHADDLVERIAAGRRVPFDLGTIDGLDGERFFLESVGIGAFAETATLLTERAETAPPAEDRDDELGRDVHVLAERIDAQEPREYEIDLDGHTVTGRCLMLEIMNTPLLGPNVRFSQGAGTSDGLLDVVIVDETERSELAEFLGGVASGDRVSSPFPTRQARQIRMTVASAVPIHVDGKTLTIAEGTVLRLGVRQHAISFLAGSRAFA
jgi:diacylglycerol kinase (ATP)